MWAVILFIPLGLSLAKQMKTDRAFAVGLIILGSYTGFMSSPVNTLTTILGQDIAGLTPYSGSGLRTVVTVINLAIVSAYLIWYAKNAQKHPERYEAAFADDTDSEENAPKYEPLKANEIGVLVLFFGSFIFFAIGGPAFGFNTLTLGSIMLPVGIVCGLLAHYDLDTLMGNFVKGAQGMVSVLIFMILASVMSVILNNSMILDSIVYYLSIPLAHLSTAMAGIGMFIAKGTAAALGGSAELRFRIGYASVYNDPKLTAFTEDFFREHETDLFEGISTDGKRPENWLLTGNQFSLGAEDFGFYSQKAPTCFIWVGTGDAASNHSPKFMVEEPYIKLCTRSMSMFAVNFLNS